MTTSESPTHPDAPPSSTNYQAHFNNISDPLLDLLKDFWVWRALEPTHD